MTAWDASLAQLVEHHLAKVIVDGSNPLTRSIFFALIPGLSDDCSDSLTYSRTEYKNGHGAVVLSCNLYFSVIEILSEDQFLLKNLRFFRMKTD